MQGVSPLKEILEAAGNFPVFEHSQWDRVFKSGVSSRQHNEAFLFAQSNILHLPPTCLPNRRRCHRQRQVEAPNVAEICDRRLERGERIWRATVGESRSVKEKPRFDPRGATSSVAGAMGSVKLSGKLLDVRSPNVGVERETPAPSLR